MPEQTYISVTEAKVLPLAISTDDNYAPYVEVLLYSLIKHLDPDWRCEVFLLIKQLKEENLQRLSAFVATLPRCRLNLLSISADFLAQCNFHTDGYFTEANYYRFFIPPLIPSYSKVLYLDIDMVIMGDLSPLMQLDMGDTYLAAVPCFAISNSASLRQRYVGPVLGLPPETPYINSGMLLFNVPACHKDNLTQQLLDTFQRIPQPAFVDQCIFNACCHSKTIVLKYEWNFISHELFSEEGLQFYSWPPKILHFTNHKPWAMPQSPLTAPWWTYRKEATEYALSAPPRELNPPQQPIRFSLIMLVHDAARYLPNCLNSIFNQSFSNFQVLACDDGSTDGSLALLQQAAQQDGRLKLFHNSQPAGNLQTRNLLIQEARGEYLVLVSPEDILAGDFLEQADTALQEQPCDILGLPYELAFPDGSSTVMQQRDLFICKQGLSPLFLNSEPDADAAVVKNEWGHQWSSCAKVFRRELLLASLPPFSDTMADLRCYLLRAFHRASSYRWKALPRCVYRHLSVNDLAPRFGHAMSLDSFRALCNAISQQLRYDLNFAASEQLPVELAMQIVNWNNLSPLIQTIAYLPPSLHLQALVIFFEYFCRNQQIIENAPYPIALEPVYNLLLQAIPNMSVETLSYCLGLSARDVALHQLVLPQEYLQAYNKLKVIKDFINGQ